ncbi:hypothetical protein [Methylobacterium nonmethylotrophicum]|uniref:Uncharacterized protein n=1 Tax=Methylobacterium nonmethylotrophicum TaxID=1141884 RepID=A0A4Z0NH61_9HYPH|nr:hypothetical protein [Methylobacterium nonmethylotrophicum]TGD94905.1 hypothetical protein EU555_30490 [Methylobacterium nonmethylotrophicum]
MSALPSSDRFGPWADGLSTAERQARLRCMRGLVHLIAGPRGQRLADTLARAEVDEDALRQSVDELGRLTPVDRRRVLASFAALHRPRIAGGADV